MEDDFLSRQDSEENSFSALMGTVDEMIEDLEEESNLVIPEGQVGVKRLLRALDALRMDLQNHMNGSKEVREINDLVDTLDLNSLSERLLKVREMIGSEHLDEFVSLTNEFEKSNALKMMKAIEVTCNSITKSINQQR